MGNANVGPVLIRESTEEQLLGVTLDKRLSFETNTQQVCIKTSQILQALARISPFMDSQKLGNVANHGHRHLERYIQIILAMVCLLLPNGHYILAELLDNMAVALSSYFEHLDG